MLVFVTTIRHPRNSTSFERVGRLLDATLASVCRQTDDEFRVVVVHNEMPPTQFGDPRIATVAVDFPAPTPAIGAVIDFQYWCRDKGTKYVIGVIAARELGADHVMLFDADDLLHRELAAHVNAQPDHPGWYSAQGYIHTIGSRRVQFVPQDFHRKNGSTGIVRCDLTEVPASLSVASSQSEIIEAMTDHYVDKMFGEHGHWAEYLEPKGHIVQPLPFAAAVWEIGTGENVTGNLVSGRVSQPIDRSLTEAFGLEPPSLGSHLLSTARINARRVARRIGRR